MDIRLPGLMSHASRFGEQVYPATAGARSSTCHRMWAFSAFLGPRPHMGSNPHMWMSPHVTSLVSRVGGPLGGQSSRLRSARSWCGPAIVPSSDSTRLLALVFIYPCVLARLAAPRHSPGFCLCCALFCSHIPCQLPLSHEIPTCPQFTLNTLYKSLCNLFICLVLQSELNVSK